MNGPVAKDGRFGIALCAVMAVGLGASLLDPSAVHRVVTVGTGLPPVVILAGWAVALSVLTVGTVLWWWGPVRLPRAAAMWQLSGPDDRATILAPRRRRALTAATCTCVLLALFVSILDVGSVPILVGVGVLCAAGIIGAATLNQQRDSVRAWTGSARTPLRLLSLNRLHRDVIAPNDGLGGALRLAAVTMDLEWIGGARAVRWQRVNTARASRCWPASRSTSLIVADLTRLARRGGDLAWWAVLIAVGCAVPLTLVIGVWEPVIAALLAYRAGSVVAGGLRQVASEPGLRRVLGGSTLDLYACHAVIPVVAVAVWTSMTGFAWHMSPAALAVIAIGAAVACVRRATRPELPFDAPVYVTNQGGVFQPLLLFAMLRGPLAVVITGLSAMLIG